MVQLIEYFADDEAPKTVPGEVEETDSDFEDDEDEEEDFEDEEEDDDEEGYS